MFAKFSIKGYPTRLRKVAEGRYEVIGADGYPQPGEIITAGHRRWSYRLGGKTEYFNTRREAVAAYNSNFEIVSEVIVE